MRYGLHNFLPLTAIALAIILLLTAFLNFTSAQNINPSQTLEVSPPSQELQTDPGQTVQARAKVRNKSNQTVTVKVRIEDFTATGDTGQVALTDNGDYSLASWTVLEPETVSLMPGETKEVTATIKVPRTEAGGRYGTFVFSVGDEKAAPGTASVAQELASLFLLRISGPVNEQLSITEFNAPGFLEFGPVPFSIKFTNVGNVHVKPFGLVNVTDIFGRVVKDVVVRGETNIFPGASRVVNINLDKQFLLGPYKAQAVLNYGSKNESLNASTSFFVFPVRVAGALLLILIVLYTGRKRLKKAMRAFAGK